MRFQVAGKRYKAFISFLALSASLTRCVSTYTRQKTLDELVDLTSFDKNHRPPGAKHEDDPVEVIIDMVFATIGPVTDATMDIVSSFYMHQHWYDSRLTFNTTIEGVREIHIISLDDLDHIWQPDLYFPKDKTTVSNEKLVPNKVAQLASDGEMYLSERITSRSHCLLDLHYYPHDKQQCDMYITSYSHSEDELVVKWKDESSVAIDTNHFIQEFQLTGTETGLCRASKMFYDVPHSCLRVTHFLLRNQGFFLAHIFVPFCLIVMFSWCGFWISHTNLSSRISTSLLTMLATITLSGSNSDRLPRVSYMKATDIWMVSCLTFVFLTFVEFRIVLIYSKKYMAYKTLLEKHGIGEVIYEDELLNEGGNLLLAESKNILVDTTPGGRKVFIQSLDEIDENAESFYSSTVDVLKVNNHPAAKSLSYAPASSKSLSRGLTSTNTLQNKKLGPTQSKRIQKTISEAMTKHFKIFKSQNSTPKGEDEEENWGRQVDHFSQILFPTAFGIWALIYCLIFVVFQQ